ncbi:MAG: hypothetical protein H7Y89_04265 [Steroidobacteraceae bacterium]|nr:hypothetical protein [Steroidobacteraceae bacterium]
MRAEPGDRFKPLPLEAQTLLTEGNTIEAIKSLRLSHGLGLKEAKDWVEAHIAQNPILRVQLEAQRRESRRKGLLAFFFVDAVLVAAIVWYFFFKP